ncbi:MAG: hypothetical protein Q4E54_03645 [Lachnospiraceae bacterium]|nr:hypothetical protein [Lachnospiraceae bacterium]
MTSSWLRIPQQSKLICACAVILLSLAVPKAYAYITVTKELRNEVTVGYCDISIVPDEQVTIRNTGTYPCYVRAAVDTASGINETDWKESDGYYYYTDSLAPGESSRPLFAGTGTGSRSIGVYAEAIDAVGETDAATAWEDFLSGGAGL